MTEGVRTTLAALREAVVEQRDAARRRLDVETTAVRAALDPSTAPGLLSELEARTGIVLDPRALPDLSVPTTAQDQDVARIQAVEALIAAALVFIGRRIAWRFFREIAAKSKLGEEPESRALTLYGMFCSAWMILVGSLAVIYMLQAVNADVTPIVASLGIFGLAVAFGAQTIVRDVFSGLFLLAENQINKGEWVIVNGIMGQIEEIGLRITTIREFYTGMIHYVPNGEIASVASYSREFYREFLEFAVPFGVDPVQPRHLIEDEIETFKADPSWSPLMRTIFLMNGVFGIKYEVSGLVYAVCIEIRGPHFGVAREFRSRIARRFQREGVPLAIPAEVELRGEDSQRVRVLSKDPAHPPPAIAAAE